MSIKHNQFQQNNVDYSDELLNEDLWKFTLETLIDNTIADNTIADNTIADNDIVSPFLSQHKEKKKKKTYRSQESIDRWNRIRRVNTFPRVLKRDIRRTYPMICINAINSGNLSLYEKYFYQYFKPNCLWTIKYMKECYRFFGHIEFFKLYRISLNAKPDFHVSMINYQIYLDPHSNKSKIIMQLKYFGTLIKCLPKDYFFLEQNILQNTNINNILLHQQQSQQSQQSQQINTNDHSYYHNNLPILSELNIAKELSIAYNDEYYQMLSQPINTEFDAYIHFFLDDNNYITQLDALILDTTFKFERLNH